VTRGAGRCSILDRNLVDKVLVFVASTIAGSGPALLGQLTRVGGLSCFRAGAVGEDILLSAYVHEP
jgi:riboflavin biosynthesis pyrimidine reductase